MAIDYFGIPTNPEQSENTAPRQHPFSLQVMTRDDQINCPQSLQQIYPTLYDSQNGSSGRQQPGPRPPYLALHWLAKVRISG